MSLQINRDSSARSLSEVLATVARKPLRKAFVCLPGVVMAFDPVTARAQVQPAIDYLIDDDTTQASHPVVLDVPVAYPAGGGYASVFPLSVGDNVLLHFSQRGLTDWRDRMDRGVDATGSAPDAGVMFRIQDAFAVPGFLAGMVNVPVDAIETRVPPNGRVLINGIDAFTTEGPLLASVSVPAGTLTSNPQLVAASDLPTGFSVVSGQLMVGTDVVWHERVQGLQVLARYANRTVASRASFGYRPSGGETKALHLNGTEASSVHVSYGEASDGGVMRGPAVVDFSGNLTRRWYATGWTVPATGYYGLTTTFRAGRFFTFLVNAAAIRNLAASNAGDDLNISSTTPRKAEFTTAADGFQHITLGRTATNELLMATTITGNYPIIQIYPFRTGGGGTSDDASPLSIAHNGAVTTQAVTIEVRLMLNGGPHNL